MEVVIDYEYLWGARGEVIKEVSLASETSSIHSVFNPYSTNPHSLPTSGLAWEDDLFLIHHYSKP